MVLLLGVTGRSGTNFLHDLLLLHPDCVRHAPRPPESFVLAEADRLVAYVDAVSRRWTGRWSTGPRDQLQLLRALGGGLRRYLLGRCPPGKHAIVKAPSVEGVQHIFELLPAVKVLLIVRDGRAVVESGVSSLGWDYESAMRSWAAGVRRIQAFQRSIGEDPARVRRVRLNVCALHSSSVQDVASHLGCLDHIESSVCQGKATRFSSNVCGTRRTFRTYFIWRASRTEAQKATT